MPTHPRPQGTAAASTSTTTPASTRGPMLPPIGALPSLSISPTNSSLRVSHSPSRVRSHSHNHSFVHTHSPSHSVPPLGGARLRSCRLPGCANFAKIHGYCAAHFHVDGASSASPSTSTAPSTRLPSLRVDQPHAVERPRLPQPPVSLYYAAPTATSTTPGHNHHQHSSPPYASDHHAQTYHHQHYHQQLPSLALRRFSEPPPLNLGQLSHPLALHPLAASSFPRVSPLHRHRVAGDDAFAPFRRAQHTSDASFKPSPTHSMVSGDDASSTTTTTTTPTLTPKTQCRREHCANAARRKGLCMEHGGRHFCKMDGCQKCAHRGGYCIAHGGGRRCAVAECTKSAQSGGVCYSHGGGKRCATDGCSHAARSGGFCIKHGKMVKAKTATADEDGDADEENDAKESGADESE